MDVNFNIMHTARPITPFDGHSTVKDLNLNRDLRKVISSSPLPLPGASKGNNPLITKERFLVKVIVSSPQLAHAGLLRHDKVFGEMLGWTEEMVKESTFCRFSSKFDIEINEDEFVELTRWWYTKQRVKGPSANIDSAIITHNGNQGTAVVGYILRLSENVMHLNFRCGVTLSSVNVAGNTNFQVKYVL